MMVGQVATLEPLWLSRPARVPFARNRALRRRMTPILMVALRLLMGACVGIAYGAALGTPGFWVAVGMLLGAGLGAAKES